MAIDKADHAAVWAALVKPLQVEEGTAVCARGQETSSLYLIESGSLVVSLSAEGQTKVVVELGAGSFFGELGLLAPALANADVVAKETSLLYELDQAAFAKMSAEHPACARGLMHAADRVLAHRVMGIESLDDVPKQAQEAQRSLLSRIADLVFGRAHKGDA